MKALPATLLAFAALLLPLSTAETAAPAAAPTAPAAPSACYLED